MLIQSLEQKTRLALMTVLVTVIGCVVICGFTVIKCMSLVESERSQIYILDRSEEHTSELQSPR